MPSLICASAVIADFDLSVINELGVVAVWGAAALYQLSYPGNGGNISYRLALYSIEQAHEFVKFRRAIYSNLQSPIRKTVEWPNAFTCTRDQIGRFPKVPLL